MGAIDLLMDEVGKGVRDDERNRPKAVTWANNPDVLARKEQERLRQSALQDDQLTRLQQDMMDAEEQKRRQGALEKAHQEQLQRIDQMKREFTQARKVPLVELLL